jgi:hypothetical protein
MSKNTFIVKINSRQRDTWQGEVIWAEEDKRQRFRSTLELMKLMNEAMTKANEDSKSDTKDSAG